MSTSKDLLRRAAESLLRRGSAFLAEEIFTHLECWNAQLQNYPESVELTNQQMFRWADGPEGYPGEARSRWRNIALALYRGNGFFYITDPKKGFVGYRYGLAAHEYLSGFGQGWHFKLADGVLIELKE